MTQDLEGHQGGGGRDHWRMCLEFICTCVYEEQLSMESANPRWLRLVCFKCWWYDANVKQGVGMWSLWCEELPMIERSLTACVTQIPIAFPILRIHGNVCVCIHLFHYIGRHCPIQGQAIWNVPNCLDTHWNVFFNDTSVISGFADYHFCQCVHISFVKVEDALEPLKKMSQCIKENAYMSTDSSVCKHEVDSQVCLWFRFVCLCEIVG